MSLDYLVYRREEPFLTPEDVKEKMALEFEIVKHLTDDKGLNTFILRPKDKKLYKEIGDIELDEFEKGKYATHSDHRGESFKKFLEVFAEIARMLDAIVYDSTIGKEFEPDNFVESASSNTPPEEE